MGPLQIFDPYIQQIDQCSYFQSLAARGQLNFQMLAIDHHQSPPYCLP
jgi:hypothetical protein